MQQSCHAALLCSFFCKIGLHCGELNVNNPATSTAVPIQKLSPNGGAAGRYGKLRVNAKMVAGTMLDITKVCTTLPAESRNGPLDSTDITHHVSGQVDTYTCLCHVPFIL